MANPMGKARKPADPYLIIVEGTWETRVLKAYSNDPDAKFARWFTAVKTPYTFGSADMGDTYIADIPGEITYRDPAVPDAALPARFR